MLPLSESQDCSLSFAKIPIQTIIACYAPVRVISTLNLANQPQINLKQV